MIDQRTLPAAAKKGAKACRGGPRRRCRRLSAARQASLIAFGRRLAAVVTRGAITFAAAAGKHRVTAQNVYLHMGVGFYNQKHRMYPKTRLHSITYTADSASWSVASLWSQVLEYMHVHELLILVMMC